MRVLVVDDDPNFRRFTALALETAGIDHEDAADGAEGLRVLEEAPEGHFDAILLDLEMPVATGWDLLFDVREKGREVPVLIVSAHEALQGRVRGLTMGADDYIVKPVEYEELIARLRAVVRRRNSLPTKTIEDLTLDLARRKVTRSGRSVHLSPREYDLLLALVNTDGELMSREELLREVWDLDFDPETNVVEVHIGRLRRKLNQHGPDVIENVRGRGYRIAGPGAPPPKVAPAS